MINAIEMTSYHDQWKLLHPPQQTYMPSHLTIWAINSWESKYAAGLHSVLH